MTLSRSVQFRSQHKNFTCRFQKQQGRAAKNKTEERKTRQRSEKQDRGAKNKAGQRKIRQENENKAGRRKSCHSKGSLN